MKKIGIIGTGSLGKMLIRGLIGKQTVPANTVHIFNRSPRKAQKFQEEFPKINLEKNNRKVVQKADWIFICVKPPDLPQLLEEIGTEFPDSKLIISTLLSPSLKDLDRLLEGKIVRIYPSVTQTTGYGVTLAAFGQKVTAAEKTALTDLLAQIGKTYTVPEKHFRLYGDITSCGPAFMAYMVGTLARIAGEHGIDASLADEMAQETMLGTALLLKNRQISFDELVCQVATPGGCTQEGINVLTENLPPVVEQIFRATASKEQAISAKVLNAFKNIAEK